MSEITLLVIGDWPSAAQRAAAKAGLVLGQG